MYNYLEQLQKKNQLEQEISALEKFIEKAPKGKLICRKKSDKRYEFSTWIRDETGKKKEIYIPQKNIAEAEQIALKEYAQKRLADCKRELRVIDQFLDFYGSEKQADQFLKTHPGINTLIYPKLRPVEERLRVWQEEDYVRNDKYKENLIYPTIVPGLFVRSKAEADIVSRLVHFRVPFRYEEQVIIDDEVYHPDFTCLNIRTLKKIYIEHQGGWDQPNYLRRNSGREEKLRRIGIIPWKNLLITTETRQQPLDINWVDILIQYYLL